MQSNSAAPAARAGGARVVSDADSVRITVAGSALDLGRAFALALGVWRPKIALDFASASATLTDDHLAALAHGIARARQKGCQVWFIRCPQAQYERLLAAGMEGPVRHTTYWTTGGDRAGGATRPVSVHLRGGEHLPDCVPELLAELTQRTPLSDYQRERLAEALKEACHLAATQGSPLGERNEVTLSFHLANDAVLVDVTDQGPAFDPSAEAARPASLEHLAGAVDSLDVLPEPGGKRVRLVKYFTAPAARSGARVAGSSPRR